MDGDEKLIAALRLIGTSGSLDGAAGSPTGKTALMTVAQKRGLVVWKRSRGCYQLTPAGYRQVEASFSYRVPFRERVARPVLVTGGLAVLAAGYIAVATARVTSHEEVRKPAPYAEVRRPDAAGGVHEVALIGTIDNPATDAPGTLSIDEAPQPATRPAPDKASPAAAESNHQGIDSHPTARERKKRRVVRKHQREAQMEQRRRYANMGPGFAFTGQVHARQSYPAYPGPPRRGFRLAQPNGWGW